MKSKLTLEDATITLLKNKELCKTFAKEQSLEDYYLDRALEEVENVSKLENKVSELKEQVEELKEKLEQASKPLEQRVAELEEDVKQLQNGLRATRRITNIWEPMK